MAVVAVVAASVLAVVAIAAGSLVESSAPSGPPPVLLSDPFLQLPRSDGVNVVWFTEQRGDRHEVLLGGDTDGAPVRLVRAETTQLSRSAEDRSSVVPGRSWDRLERRPVWRHEARVDGLEPGERTPYRVRSVDGARVGLSGTFTLGPAPVAGTPLRILLTSDHQQMPMTAANLEQVVAEVGRPDAVFVAGDLVNIPDRASEWFDSERGGFFALLQGRGDQQIAGRRYRGGEILQHAPVYPAVGNHEVMGRVDAGDLFTQFESPLPRRVARRLVAEEGVTGPAAQRRVQDLSFNTVTYEEIFSLPDTSPGRETYYATTVGDVRLISLFATQIWRAKTVEPGDRRSAFVERGEDLDDPAEQGWGQHIFEPIDRGSEQYEWLERELRSEEFTAARYRVVLLHHPIHSLGDNVSPAFTDPVRIEERDDDGGLTGVRYEYPADRDHLLRDVEPLLAEAGVDLVLNGHSHLWNSFRGPGGIVHLESSNVGNTYGAFVEGGRRRFVPPEPWPAEDATPAGDPGGLRPRPPSGQGLTEDGRSVPYVASNEITVFSVLDTGEGVVTSYAFDTTRPDEGPWVLDRLALRDP